MLSIHGPGQSEGVLEAPADQPLLASRPRQGQAERRLTCLRSCDGDSGTPGLVKGSEVFQAGCILVRGLELPLASRCVPLLKLASSAHGAKHGRALTCRRLWQIAEIGPTALAEPGRAFCGSSAAPVD